MRFEWDEAKRRSNLNRHGLDFIDVVEVFRGTVFSCVDDRFDYDEIRFLTIGVLEDGVVA
jgi:uncharacterized protein